MGQKKVVIPQDVAEFALQFVQARLVRLRSGAMRLFDGEAAELERYEATLKECLKEAK